MTYARGLLYWKFKDQESNSTTLFPFYSAGKFENGAGSYLAMTPLFWKYKTEENTGSFLIPVYYNNYSLLSQTRVTFIAPAYWCSKSRDVVSKGFFPVWWNFTKTTAWDTSYSNVLFPLYWKYKNGEANSTTLFPIYSKATFDNGEGKYLALTPLFWKYRTAQEKRTLLAPFYFNSYSFLEKTRKIVIAPLYWSCADTSFYSKMVFPFWWSSKKYSRGDTLYSRIVFPVFWKFNSQRASSLTLFPLFSKGSYNEGASHYIAITPMFWQYKTPFDRGTYIPLLFSSNFSSLNKTEKINIAEIFFYHKKIKFCQIMLLPLWKYTENINGKDTSERNFIFPFYWSFEINGERNHVNDKVLFPFVWSRKDTLYRSFTFFPLFSFGHTPDYGSAYQAITPLFWHYSNKQGNGTVIPLLFSTRFSAINDSHRTYIAPAFWFYKSKDEYKRYVVPLVWSSKTVVGKDTAYRNILFPVYWSTTINGVRNQVRNKILFPFLWSLNDSLRRSFTVFPIFSAGHSKNNTQAYLDAGLLFWHKNWNEVRNGTELSSGHSNVLFPLYWHYKNTLNKNESQQLLNDNTILFPFYWSFSQQSKRRAYIFPFIFLKNDSGRQNTSILWPFIEFDKAKDYTYFRLSPVIWYKHSPGVNYFSIQPFYYHGKDRTSESHRIFWELLTWENISGKKKSVNVLWKFLTLDRYENKDHEYRLCYSVYTDIDRNGDIIKGGVPFYKKLHLADGTKYVNIFCGFYQATTRRVADSKEFYKEVKIFWNVMIKSNFKELQKKGIDRKQIRKRAL